MDAKTQEAMRDVSITLRIILQEDDRNGSHLKKKNARRNGRLAAVRLFARENSIRRTSEARFI